MARLPLLPGPTGVERGRLQQADGPTDWGTLGGKAGGHRAGWPAPAVEEGLRVSRPPAAGWFLLVASRRAERGARREPGWEPETRDPPHLPTRQRCASVGAGAAPVRPKSQGEGLPGPVAQPTGRFRCLQVRTTRLRGAFRAQAEFSAPRWKARGSVRRGPGAQVPAPPALRSAERSPLSAGKYIFWGRVKARLSFELLKKVFCARLSEGEICRRPASPRPLAPPPPETSAGGKSTLEGRSRSL